jgi:hypothetical protein
VHLAQLNVARMIAPLDSPDLADFVARLDAVNAAAEEAPGFVWRLVDDEGANATGIHPLGDDMLLVNLSVWESPQALIDFVYRDSGHAAALRKRREWFERASQATVVGWWVPEGHRPTVEDAMERLRHLREYGSTPYAFPLTLPTPPPPSDA